MSTKLQPCDMREPNIIACVDATVTLCIGDCIDAVRLMPRNKLGMVYVRDVIRALHAVDKLYAPE